MMFWGKLLTLYLLLLSLLGGGLYTTYDHLKQDYLQQREDSQRTAYDSVLQANRRLADTFFFEVINKPNILSLVEAINESEGDEQALQRGLLYRELAGAYHRNKTEITEILHFHNPESVSILRFHLPQVWGDDLSALRPSVDLCNQLKHEVHGFESGRIVHGFRHVYPLTYQDRHIGSVEVSQPYHLLYGQVQQVDTAVATQFVFFQTVAPLQERLFEHEKRYYISNELHPRFVRQHQASKRLGPSAYIEPISENVLSALEQLENNQRVQSLIDQEVDFTEYVKTDTGSCSVIFYAVKNVSGELTGYLMGFTPEPHINYLFSRFGITFIGLAVVMLFGFLYRGRLQHVVVERKEIQDALRAFFNNNLVGVVQLDTEGRYLRCNEQWESMTGYRREELLQKSYTDLTDPRDLNSGSLFQQFSQSRHNQALELTKRYVRKDGTVFWATLSGMGLYKNNQFTGMVGMITDITKSKENEEAIRKHNEELRVSQRIVSSVSELLSFVDRDYVYRSVNKNYCLYHNKNSADIVGLSVAEVHGDDVFASVIKPEIDRALQGKPVHYEAWFDFPGVGRRYVLVEYTPHRNEEGLISGLVVAVKDISERKRHEDLLQTRLKLSSLFATASTRELQQIFVDEAERMTDSTLGFLHFIAPNQNDISLQIWSTNTTERLCQAAEHDTHYTIDQAGVWVDCVRENRPVMHNDYSSLPHRKGTPEGHPNIIRDLAVPIYQDDSIVAILGVGNKSRDYEQVDIDILVELGALAWDIIARKQALEQQQELETQLRQKFKMEAVGVMAGGIAHNFNNNLAIILGNVELSQMKSDELEIKGFLENAKIAVLRSRDLIRQILSYSRKGMQSKTGLQLPMIIDETLKLLHATIPSTVRMHQTICDECYRATIHGDASQIQEILLNLCNNAVHAMQEKGDLTVVLDVISLSEQDIPEIEDVSAGRYVHLSVQDTGCGIPPDIKNKIFDPFFTTKEMHEGTGMGLATVHGIIKQHDGMITLESALNKGSTFHLYFPLIEQEKTILEDKGSLQDVPAGTERILFVDDDEMLASMGEMMLSELGYRVTKMIDSREALKLFASDDEPFDLVITDQTMPHLCGKDLIQELKGIRPGIPTILCTGFSSKIDEDSAAEQGISAFLMKPLDMPTLLQTVRRVLDEGKEQ